MQKSQPSKAKEVRRVSAGFVELADCSAMDSWPAMMCLIFQLAIPPCPRIELTDRGSRDYTGCQV